MSTGTSDYIIVNAKPVNYCLLLLLVHVTVDNLINRMLFTLLGLKLLLLLLTTV